MHDHFPSYTTESNLHIRFAAAFILNAVLTLIQMIYAWEAASVSLLSDAIHNLSDILGLLMAWGAHLLLQYTRACKRYSYGYKKATILLAFFHVLLLFLSVGFFIHEAIEMLTVSKPIDEISVIIVATLSMLINGSTACLFLRFREKDVNIKAAFLHLIIDALTSLGVLMGAILIYYTQYSWIDAAMALLISSFIMVSSWNLLRYTFRLILDAVPININPDKVSEYLRKIPGVNSIHDLHIWAISTQEVALTAHLMIAEPDLKQIHYQSIQTGLLKEFRIQHVTLQIESLAFKCPQLFCCK
jgi:cobalt-zinc-cadmium efflux system protein